MCSKVENYLSPRERVKIALDHQEPDRAPADFLATPEVWDKLIKAINPEVGDTELQDFVEPEREAILKHLMVDCRLLSYDMFYSPPTSMIGENSSIDWWNSLSRSTPNRMWRKINNDGSLEDIWGICTHKVENPFGSYEELLESPLAKAETINDLKNYSWPEPDWWEFSPIPLILSKLDQHNEYHIRYRVGSVFETAWQLRGMEKFLMELAIDPEIPLYIMDRIDDIHVENTRRVLELAKGRFDMVYFYDDIATQDSLMISPEMWRKHIRPRHQKLVEVTDKYNCPVMYHCDGAVYKLIPDLIDLGIDVLNPIQPNIQGMEAEKLKNEFGENLSFHGGIDIVNTLPKGSPKDVSEEVKDKVKILGKGGGYILCSSHHIQPDVPLDNVLAMYELDLRYSFVGEHQ